MNKYTKDWTMFWIVAAIMVIYGLATKFGLAYLGLTF